ncbi:hypothetical protein JKA74_15015 [Marivirga sp. S37H4]|uniref:Uncharacterized protein n=1 Tax=Marivirga aurantiaca TaxID=2802615 RepID=A0A934X005_9BACT|nr:hypothetical protein [Marivirga aurantiaca]MBK6266354.1 hypothetical protein [Marivirga aurantiaca]
MPKVALRPFKDIIPYFNTFIKARKRPLADALVFGEKLRGIYGCGEGILDLEGGAILGLRWFGVFVEEDIVILSSHHAEHDGNGA